MAKKKTTPAPVQRGGSKTAREKGLVGVLMFFTPAGRKRLALAQAMTGAKDLRTWATAALEAAAERDIAEYSEKEGKTH